MPGSVSLTVGTNTATLSLNGTNVQINNVILRFLKARGVVTEGLNATQLGEAYLSEVKKITMDYSMNLQREEGLRSQRIALETQINTDNAI